MTSPSIDVPVLTREDLVRLSRRSTDALGAVFQSSSGSSGEILTLPRTQDDIADTFRRVARCFVAEYGHPPKRVALLGGISHAEAALRCRFGASQVGSFSLDEIERLEAFEPDVVSCYPSIARELWSDPRISLKRLKAWKLGGERVFRSDLVRLADRWPRAPVIEQFGSTEMPAVALRVHREGDYNEIFTLEEQRFCFRLAQTDGWQPLIVRDTFPDRLFDGWYDTGDEVLLRDQQVVALRRRGDPASALYALGESLLKSGCVNVQFHLADGLLAYTGPVELPLHIGQKVDGWKTERRDRLDRLSPSNKLPLVRP